MRKRLAVATVVASVLLAGCADQVNTDLQAAGEAEDTAATANLQTGAVAASGYYAENASYVGFNAAAAEGIEPALQWTDGAPAQGQISIRGASQTGVVLVTMSQSGTPMCLAWSLGQQSMGKVDASTPDACTGGW